MKYCRYCGAEIVDEAKFCPHCGADVQAAAAPGAAPSAPVAYDRKLLKRQSRAAFHANYGVCLGVFLLSGLIISVVGGVGYMFQLSGGELEAVTISTGGSSLLALVLSGVVAYGVCNFFLNIFRAGDNSFSQMFAGFERFGQSCGAGLLIALFTFLWSLLLLVPGIIKAYSYSMTYYVMKDHPELTVREAIRASQRMMDGHKGQLFVLQLSYIWWYLLSALTAGLLALFYVGPWLTMAQAGFYQTIKADYRDPR